MRLASVIVDVATQALDRAYWYLAPESAGSGETAIEVGSCVVVPLGGRKAVGFVVQIADFPSGELPEGINESKLRAIEQVVGGPYFDEEGAACAQWLADRYIAPLSSCIHLFTPPGGVPRMVRSGNGHWRLEEPAIGAVDDRWVSLKPQAADFTPRKNAVKQRQILDALQGGELRVAELAAEFGSVSQALGALQQKGVITVERRRRLRGMEAQSPRLVDESELPQLTEGQVQAIEAINRARAARNGSVVLIDGVTGSGKTEVYLRAIQEELAQGRSACVLVPEISLTPQTVARFRGRFGDQVAVLHSRMGTGERFDQWDLIRSGQARVVVGARSALFAPLGNLGLIVIDEEHESTYKQESAPRYHARDVAIWMARRAGATVVLGSATPAIESLYAAKFDPLWTCVRLSERANGKPLPPVHVVDMAREFKGGSRAMFSAELADGLRNALSQGHKAVLLLNQRGFAKFLLCRDCGFVPSCPSCSTSLTYHERGNKLICHHCGYQQPAPATCPQCESPYLRKFGAGTQRVEDELRALLDGFGPEFCQVPIIRMDADTTSGKGAHQRLLEAFGAAPSAVLLGTQMIAKGLDFDDVTLVGVVNADTQLYLPDYRASERTFDLIEQVAGRAGRANLKGEVMVQTYQADASAIKAAAAYDRAEFLRSELPKRKALRYPPYVRLANVLVWGQREDAVRAGAEQLQQAIAQRVSEQTDGSWQVLAATPCVLSKLRGTYRWHVVVKAPLDAPLSEVLLPVARSMKPSRDFNMAIDIDPLNLL